MKRCSSTPNRGEDLKRYARTPLSPNAEDAENADENAENADANCIRPSPPREMRCKSKVLQVTLQAMARNPQNLQVQTSGCAVLCDAARGQVRTHTHARQNTLVHSRPLARPLPLSFAHFPFVSISLARARALFLSLPLAVSLSVICSFFCSLLFSFFLSLPHGRAAASPFLFLFLSFFSSRARGGKGALPHSCCAPPEFPNPFLGRHFPPVSRPRFLRRQIFPLMCAENAAKPRKTTKKLADLSTFQDLLLSPFTVHEILEFYISL